MSLLIDPLWLTAVFLIGLRIAPLFIMAPVLGASDIPVRVRVLLGFAFAATLAAVTGTTAGVAPLTSFGPFLSAAISELVIGMAMVFASSLPSAPSCSADACSTSDRFRHRQCLRSGHAQPGPLPGTRCICWPSPCSP
jgi:hypothetical protein